MQTINRAPVCRTCGGNKSFVVNTPEGPKKMPCPACRGTGRDGLVTKVPPPTAVKG